MTEALLIFIVIVILIAGGGLLYESENYLEIKKKVESTQNQLNRANDELSKYKKEVNKLKNDNDVLKEMSNERIRKFWLMYDDNT